MTEYNYKIDTSYEDNLVSIIIPTYNRCKLITETIESLLNQNYSNIEILVIDDNSTDDTVNVIKSYMEKYDFIHYHRSDKSGACAARNLGLSLSRGEFIQFIDDDDLVHKDYIKLRIDALILNEDCDFATCNMIYFDDSTKLETRRLRIDHLEHTVESHLMYAALSTQLFMFRRRAILKMGFWDEGCLRYQDVRYYHRLFLLSFKGVWLPNFLYFIRLHHNSISTKYDIKILNSILDVYKNIGIEWRDQGKFSDKLSRILFILSFNIILNSSKDRRFWGIQQTAKLIGNNVGSFAFFCRFLFNRAIKKGLKASDFYLKE